MFGGPADTREESMISMSLETISAAEREDGLPWADLGVGGPFLSKGLHFRRPFWRRGCISDAPNGSGAHLFDEGGAFST